MTHFILNMHNAQKQHFILSWGGSINMFAHHKMYAKSYVWNLSKWRCCRIYRFLYNAVVQEIPASFYKLTTSSKTWIWRSAQFFLRKITSEDKPNHLMDLEEAFLSLKERKEKTKQDFSVLSRVQTFRHFLKDEVSPQNDTFGKRKT